MILFLEEAESKDCTHRPSHPVGKKEPLYFPYGPKVAGGTVKQRRGGGGGGGGELPAAIQRPPSLPSEAAQPRELRLENHKDQEGCC